MSNEHSKLDEGPNLASPASANNIESISASNSGTSYTRIIGKSFASIFEEGLPCIKKSSPDLHAIVKKIEDVYSSSRWTAISTHLFIKLKSNFRLFLHSFRRAKYDTKLINGLLREREKLQHLLNEVEGSDLKKKAANLKPANEEELRALEGALTTIEPELARKKARSVSAILDALKSVNRDLLKMCRSRYENINKSLDQLNDLDSYDRNDKINSLMNEFFAIKKLPFDLYESSDTTTLKEFEDVQKLYNSIHERINNLKKLEDDNDYSLPTQSQFGNSK